VRSSDWPIARSGAGRIERTTEEQAAPPVLWLHRGVAARAGIDPPLKLIFDRASDHVAQLLAGDQLELRVLALGIFDCALVEYAAGHEDATGGMEAGVVDEPDKLAEGPLEHPAIPVMLALHEKNLAGLAKDDVDTTIGGRLTYVLYVVPLSMVVGRNQLLELDPRHIADLSHCLVERQQPLVSAFGDYSRHCHRRRQIGGNQGELSSHYDPLRFRAAGPNSMFSKPGGEDGDSEQDHESDEEGSCGGDPGTAAHEEVEELALPPVPFPIRGAHRRIAVACSPPT